MLVTTSMGNCTLDIHKHRRQLREMRARHHEGCTVCSTLNDSGLHAEFDVREDGGVEASLICGNTKEGYEGLVHGGVIASLLDGAMASCLFSYGIVAVTGEMTTRMLHPVSADESVLVRGRFEKDRAPLYIMSSEMSQHGRIVARASGKFVDSTRIRIKE